MLSTIFSSRRGISQSCLQLTPRFVDLLSSTNLKPQLSPNYQRTLENAPRRKDLQKVSLVKRHEEKLKEEAKSLGKSLGKSPSGEAQDAHEGKSKSQQFRELPYSKNVLEKIEKEKMGKITKLKVAKNAPKEEDPNAPGDKDPDTLRVSDFFFTFCFLLLFLLLILSLKKSLISLPSTETHLQVLLCGRCQGERIASAQWGKGNRLCGTLKCWEIFPYQRPDPGGFGTCF